MSTPPGAVPDTPVYHEVWGSITLPDPSTIDQSIYKSGIDFGLEDEVVAHEGGGTPLFAA